MGLKRTLDARHQTLDAARYLFIPLLGEPATLSVGPGVGWKEAIGVRCQLFPVYRFYSVSFQVLVTPAEMPVAEETP